MINLGSYLNIADNTGASVLMCIRSLGFKKKNAKIGDVIVGVIKAALPHMQVKKSDVVKALIVRTKHLLRRNDGSILKFDDNACILLNAQRLPLGTRITGPIPYEIKSRLKDYSKVFSLADSVI